MPHTQFLLPPVNPEQESAAAGPRARDSVPARVERHPRGARASGSSRGVWVRRSVFACAAVLVLTLGWVGIRGGLAASAAFSASGEVSRLGSMLADGNVAGARLVIPAVQARAEEARTLTSDPVWRAVETVPWLGGNLTAVRKSFHALDGIATDGLGPLVDLSDGRAEDLLTEGTNERRVSIVRLTPAFTALAAALQAAVSTADEVDADNTIPALGDAFTEARSSLRSYAAAAAAATALSNLVPSLLDTTTAQEWTVTVTAERPEGPTAIAVLLATTAGGAFVVTEARAAKSAPATEQDAQGGALTIDTSAFPYLMGQTGPISVPGVGEVTAGTVLDITSTGLYAQAGSTEEAEALVGAVAATLIGSLVN